MPLRPLLLACALAGAGACMDVREPAPLIELDGGKRWVLDEHARAVFARMREAAAAPAEDAAARRALGAEQQALLAELIEGCTMTGTAHERLHQFLGLYAPAVDALALSGSPDDAAQLRALLELHARSFE